MRRDVFQAIADPTRREILGLLAHQKMNLNAVAQNFEISRPAISKHLKILTECGLVTIEQQGRERYCEANLKSLEEVSEWLEQYRAFWTTKLDALGDFLNKETVPETAGKSPKAKLKKQMKIPENVQTYGTEIGTYWFDADGLLNSLSKNTMRTVENTRHNFDLVQRITHGKLVCHLVHVTNSKKPTKETRDYVNSRLPEVYKAMALVSKGGIGELIMGFLFRFLKPAIPMKIFTDEQEARAWLKHYM